MSERAVEEKRKREKGEKKCIDKVQIDKYVISINLHC